VATALARRCTSASYPEIARAIGRPNHSTVITAHQRLTEQLSRNEMVDAGDGQPVALAALLDELAARIGAAGSARTA
jgi:chromosomal replication initiator protein